MIDFHRIVPVKKIAIGEASLVTSGICLFALFIHKDNYLQIISLAGLIFSGIVITRSINDLSSLLSTFGIIPFRKKVISYIIIGIVSGSIVGIVYNYSFEDSFLPSTLTRFAIMAPLIGITEELVFRGYVQTKTVSSGAWFSIIFASFGHTLYKFIVIASLLSDQSIDFPRLIVYTFTFGIALGILRNNSKNVFPPALAHAFFDIVVYGGAAVAPVWIWG